MYRLRLKVFFYLSKKFSVGFSNLGETKQTRRVSHHGMPEDCRLLLRY